MGQNYSFIPPSLVNYILNTNSHGLFLRYLFRLEKGKQRAQNLCHDILLRYQACVAIPFANSSLFECKYLKFLSI